MTRNIFIEMVGLIFEGINTVYLKQSSELQSDVKDKQLSNVDIFLKQLESELWVS